MKKIVLTMACGALLISGFLFTTKLDEETASRPPSPTMSLSMEDVKM
ncbi:hypothetical protein [Virgibacillus dokdonensis]|uniref:Uncharacterized protein n=1 Tax=Virgibacillus dokdonensis TaxID=302167 RepID=A0A2K9IXY5_9BACI|nr:hypothetical protein [Virgibacillus dokdonensis]AUJ23643.1 hypothetical protein A21D_00530 [Virgibacillus dokdonensis]